MTPATLGQEISAYFHERTEAVIKRFYPSPRLPGFFAGHRTSFMDAAELISVLPKLADNASPTHAAGLDLSTALPALLRQIDGPATQTFYSFRIAETLLAHGKFDGNPLLRGLTDAELANIREAVDTTSIYDPATRTLKHFPNNYWAVLARCEYARQQLGLLDDTSVLETALERVNETLFRNPSGFFDDSRDFSGRYDIYTAETQLFLKPLWPLLDPEKLDHNLRQHVRLMETIALENGALFAWGRSIGALSLCMTIELGATALQRGLAADPQRTLGLVKNAFDAFKGWIEDDLISAHRHRMTDAYRGPQRLMQMTLDCLDKLHFSAGLLAKAPAFSPASATASADASAPSQPAVLFPPTDTWVPFEENRPAGIWMFRNAQLAFQFPVVGLARADYVGWFHGPGLFENPVDSPMLCGLPLIVSSPGTFTSANPPERADKTPDGLSLRFNTFTPFDGVKAGQPAPAFNGSREVSYRVEADTVIVNEHWEFDTLPDAIGFQIPETDRALALEISGDVAFTQNTVVVDGISEWRSAWSQLRRVHQVDFTPARSLRFTWRLRPRLRVTTIPGNHDYVRALYDAMPAGALDERQRGQSRPLSEMNVAAFIGDNDIIHVGWPEHLFNPAGLDTAEFDRRNLAFIAELGRAPVKIVWTMHNRRPHHAAWHGERGKQLYEAWARIADGVIHHSAWGRDLMLAELPYKADARHVVLPHGHYGEQMPRRLDRAALEKKLNLPPCTVRFGVLGRAQKEKQVDLIIRAFKQAAVPGHQLFVTATPVETDVSDDPRIVLYNRTSWLSRDDMAEHIHVCDALISAHTGDTYLTSGAIADAIGAGIPMVANDWAFFKEMFGGDAWYHDNTETGLAATLARLTPADIAKGKTAFTALQPAFAWPHLAAETLALQRTLECPLAR